MACFSQPSLSLIWETPPAGVGMYQCFDSCLEIPDCKERSSSLKRILLTREIQ